MTSRRFGVSSVTGVCSIMAVSRRVAALCGSAGVALFALSGTALAEDKFAWSASLTGTSDYVYRGLSQSDNDPAIQGSIGATYGMFYAGTWASSIDFADKLEVDYYAGVTPSWQGFNFDFGWIYYNYPSAQTFDFWEAKAGVSKEIVPKLTAGGTFYYTPDFGGNQWYTYEGTLAYELPKTWVFTPTVNGLVGYTDFDDNSAATGLPDYTYWNAGLALAVDNLTFDFRYWDTDAGATKCNALGYNANACGEKFVFSATVSMP